MRHIWLSSLVLGFLPAVASAGHVDFRFNVGLPIPYIGFGAGCGYYGHYGHAYYAPVYYRSYCGPSYYCAPPVVTYAPPPVVYRSAPVVVYGAPPVYVAPGGCYYGPSGRYHCVPAPRYYYGR